jgi:Na+-transporting NADH:ubiquinone oxidoreductase subunit F
MITVRKFHKWLALAIGLQVLIWVTSGLIISILDHQIVAGNTTKIALPASESLGDVGTLFPIDRLQGIPSDQFEAVTLRRLGDLLVYQIDVETSKHIYNAATGEPVTITRTWAERNALASYQGKVKIVSSNRLAEGSPEAPGSKPVWRVDFDDSLATRVYVSDIDGRVLAHRNRYWKVVDFLLMLHFMDYVQEGSFNNIQIIVVGFAALWLSLFGMLLVVKGFTRRDFTWRGLTR